MNRPTNPKYDYQNQAWTSQEPEDVRRYEDCGHPETVLGKTMKCSCYGRLHAGEPVTAAVLGQIAQHDQDNEDMRRLGVDVQELVRRRRKEAADLIEFFSRQALVRRRREEAAAWPLARPWDQTKEERSESLARLFR